MTLRELRRTAGYTQARLATELGITKSALGSYEQGQRRIPQSVVVGVWNLFQQVIDEPEIEFGANTQAYRDEDYRLLIGSLVLAATARAEGNRRATILDYAATAERLNADGWPWLKRRERATAEGLRWTRSVAS